MILTGEKIIKEVKNENIIISPFSDMKITTNSYDLSLSDVFIRYTGSSVDPKKSNPHKTIKASANKPIHMEKGDFLLGASVERIGSTKYVPIIHNKSSIARLGLFVHITADLIDIGSIGNITFQLYATLPITLYPGMLIGQVSFRNTLGKIKLYDGKYQDSSGPAASKIFMDFVKNHE